MDYMNTFKNLVKILKLCDTNFKNNDRNMMVLSQN
jgi:hypothetical protein